jgi:putative transposase
MVDMEQGKYYHVYNRGNNRENIFREKENYWYFLRLHDKYIRPVAQTYAWCLMPNHFHLLVRIKENIIYKYSNADRSVDAVRFEENKWETVPLFGGNQSAPEGPECVDMNSATKITNNPKIPQAHLHFSHMFNAYTKHINKRYCRTGSLFQRPFRKLEICTEDHFRQLVIYLHTNPVNHGFTDDFKDFPWTSYRTMLSIKPTKLERDEVLGWFGDRENFIELHNRKIELELNKDLLME